MKTKFLCLMTLVLSIAMMSGCKSKQTLYLLNWGEYMKGDLITAFEKKYNCRVEPIINESNEDMYSVIANNQYPIDIAIPSDYMVQKLYNEKLLQEIDFTRLENYQDGIFDDDLETLRANYFQDNQKYAIPYFWGTIGIMYNDRTAGLDEIIRNNGWNVFFDKTLTAGLPNSVKIGMYNNPRDSIAVAELAAGISLNTTSNADYDTVRTMLVNQKKQFPDLKYDSDDLKKYVAGGKNLDFAMVYSGDFFDQLYIIEEEGSDNKIDFYVPEKTNVYFDAMVIPTTSKNTDLAYKFLDFFLETENVLANVEYVGYCPGLKSAYQALLEDEYWSNLIEKYPFHPGKSVAKGEIYFDLGDEIYNKMFDIYRAATTAK